MVHPCGSGAFGHFECTKDMSNLTFVTLHLIDKSGRLLDMENKREMLIMKPAARRISSGALVRRRQSSSASAPSPLDASFLIQLATREVSLSSFIQEKETTILSA